MTGKLLWFLAGVGMGTVAGVFYAPKSGEQTRETIRAQAQKGREFVRQQRQRASEQTSQWVDRGREVLNEQKAHFQEAYEVGRRAYRDATIPKTGTGS